MSMVRLIKVSVQNLSQEGKGLIGIECFVDLEINVPILFV